MVDQVEFLVWQHLRHRDVHTLPQLQRYLSSDRQTAPCRRKLNGKLLPEFVMPRAVPSAAAFCAVHVEA